MGAPPPASPHSTPGTSACRTEERRQLRLREQRGRVPRRKRDMENRTAGRSRPLYRSPPRSGADRIPGGGPEGPRVGGGGSGSGRVGARGRLGRAGLVFRASRTAVGLCGILGSSSGGVCVRKGRHSVRRQLVRGDGTGEREEVAPSVSCAGVRDPRAGSSEWRMPGLSKSVS